VLFKVKSDSALTNVAQDEKNASGKETHGRLPNLLENAEEKEHDEFEDVLREFIEQTS
jgi:hypothetical protein